MSTKSHLSDFIRPSTLGALAICHGRAQQEWLVSRRLPTLLDESSPQATQGTYGHLYIATYLTQAYDSPVQGTTVAMYPDGMTPWTSQSARRCIAYAVQIHETTEKKHGRVKTLIEQRLPGRALGFASASTCTADLIYLAGKHAAVIDWKLGFLEVESAASSLQLAAYVALVFRKWPYLETVDVHLGQGRVHSWTATTYHRDQSTALERRIKGITSEAVKPDAKLVCDIAACRYCIALPACMEARRTMEQNRLMNWEAKDLLELDAAIRLAQTFADRGKQLQKKLRESPARPQQESLFGPPEPIQDRALRWADAIYAEYPRKVKPQDARKAIIAAIKKHDPHMILDAVKAYAQCPYVKSRKGTDQEQFIPHPASWIRAERFLDDQKDAQWTSPYRPSGRQTEQVDASERDFFGEDK